MVVGEMTQEVELLVVGAGPGGYPAALRAAELGIKCLLVDARTTPGGVCLHEGCIPSKALLHAAETLESAILASAFGIKFGNPKIDLAQLRSWKQNITDKLAQGITGMCKGAGVEIVQGRAVFEDSRNVRIEDAGQGSPSRVKFKHAILATGSRPLKLRGIDLESPLLLDSGSALDLADIPDRLLIVGGGYIGLEMGTVYSALGSKVAVVEMTDGLLPGVDRDLVRPLAAHLEQKFESIWLNTKVSSLKETAGGISVSFEGKDAPETATFNKVLISVGRRPNSDNIGLENTQVEINKQGFVVVDEQCRTGDKRIFAVGDVSGQPMLAHRATRQGVVAAEVLAGLASAFDNRAIPAVVFTEPEIAWCGLTETEAKAQGLTVAAAKFPWSASGRAQSLAQPAGQTKVIFDPESTAVLGAGIVGPRAGELIAEAVLAIEMGATLEDLVVTIHPHPSLSETIMEAATAARARLERQKFKTASAAKPSL